MINALSENNLCDSGGLDSQKEAVGDSVTSDLPKKKPTNNQSRSARTYSAKHALHVDFRKVKVDGRSTLGKYMKTLKANLTKDLGGSLTTMEEILLDRIVSKIVQSHLYETGILSGQDFGSRDFYLAVCNSLRHDLNVIGLKKRVKNPVDLESYLKGKEKPNES
jgi:hypothetical protein